MQHVTYWQAMPMEEKQNPRVVHFIKHENVLEKILC